MNGTVTLFSSVKSIITAILFFFISFASTAQPDYVFKNPSLVSGTINKKDAVYLFENVRPGLDAHVTVTKISSGIKLIDVDEFGGSGYDDALQPTVEANNNKAGYVEFTIDFFHAGTTTPYVQVEVPMTAIDVDGDSDEVRLGLGHTLAEYVEVSMGTNSYVVPARKR